MSNSVKQQSLKPFNNVQMKLLDLDSNTWNQNKQRINTK